MTTYIVEKTQSVDTARQLRTFIDVFKKKMFFKLSKISVRL